MKHQNKCLRCERLIPRGLKFCNPCARYISAAHDNIRERAAAAVCFLRNRKPDYNGYTDDRQTKFKQEEAFAFLQIFHPEMNQEKAMRLSREIRD